MPRPQTRRPIRELRHIAQSRRLVTITAYDYPTGRLADDAGFDFILVGDSLGMVALGFEDTTWVTLDHMLHHTAAVSRGVTHTPIVADLPFETYDCADDALSHGRRLINAGADAIKLEGGRSHLAQIEKLIANRIPVIGHLGMLPQSIRSEGTYKKKGKIATEADDLMADALALDAAGVEAIVLESVVPEVARQITQALNCPTIGIGCGELTCSGEVAVITDILGSFPWFVPPFAKAEAQLAKAMSQAFSAYRQRVLNP